MRLYLNGQFVPEDQARISVFDRGFLYGDGLFETLRVAHGRPFRWTQHFERLERGAAALRLTLPFSAQDAFKVAGELIALNQMPEALLRLAISRGRGPRGYSIREVKEPTVVMSIHPLPAAAAFPGPAWKLHTATMRLPADDHLAPFKTSNKLVQILARAEAETSGADEALICNTAGEVVEASSGNLFWVAGESVCTPPLSAGVLPGITRAVVRELCDRQGLAYQEANLRVEALRKTQGVFLTLSSLGIVEAASLNGEALSKSPIVFRLQSAYASLLEVETR